MSTWRPAKPSDDSPRGIGEALDRVSRSLGMGRADTLRAVFGRWAEVVGEQIAAHASPSSLRDGVLVVTVDEPVWATQLRWLEADLLRRLDGILGDGAVTKIEVQIARPGRSR